jgi:hypothetical protein
MKKIRELFQKPLYTAIAGFLVGLLIGLPILGWLVWPVQWYDAAPVHLSEYWQLQYLCSALESFGRTGDAASARTRFEGLGDKSANVLELVSSSCGKNDITLLQNFKTAIGSTSSSLPSTTGQTAFPTPTAGVKTKASNTGNIILLVVLCLVTLGVGAALFYFFVLRNRKLSGNTKPARASQEMPEAESHGVSPDQQQSEDQPISQFMTSYILGDDLYDDSFSIDSPTGEFLGECGVGISETIGVGDPKKVTAFEVWLFDKNDIQTVTKILMSKHAYNDPTIRQRLMAKGELIIVEPGQQVLLETASLQLEARIVDGSYGQGALPDGSFFDKLTLELNVWQKV